jgi:hypothetical protein
MFSPTMDDLSKLTDAQLFELAHRVLNEIESSHVQPQLKVEFSPKRKTPDEPCAIASAPKRAAVTPSELKADYLLRAIPVTVSPSSSFSSSQDALNPVTILEMMRNWESFSAVSSEFLAAHLAEFNSAEERDEKLKHAFSNRAALRTKNAVPLPASALLTPKSCSMGATIIALKDAPDQLKLRRVNFEIFKVYLRLDTKMGKKLSDAERLKIKSHIQSAFIEDDVLLDEIAEKAKEISIGKDKPLWVLGRHFHFETLNQTTGSGYMPITCNCNCGFDKDTIA